MLESSEDRGPSVPRDTRCKSGGGENVTRVQEQKRVSARGRPANPAKRKIEATHSCPLCPRLCASRTNVLAHLASVHYSRQMVERFLPRGVRRRDGPFRCPDCGVARESGCTLLKHLAAKHERVLEYMDEEEKVVFWGARDNWSFGQSSRISMSVSEAALFRASDQEEEEGQEKGREALQGARGEAAAEDKAPDAKEDESGARDRQPP